MGFVVGVGVGVDVALGVGVGVGVGVDVGTGVGVGVVVGVGVAVGIAVTVGCVIGGGGGGGVVAVAVGVGVGVGVAYVTVLVNGHDIHPEIDVISIRQRTIVPGRTNLISLTSRISTENYFLLIFILLVTKRIAIKDRANPLKKIITLFFPLTVNIMTS